MADSQTANAMIETARGLARDFAETFELHDKLNGFPHEEMAKLKKAVSSR